nr:hypothetical protein [Tanacetum cinerariifolium]
MEKVLQENDRLLTQALSVEIVNIVVHGYVNFDCLNVDACAHCRDTVSSPESAPIFFELFKINDLKAQVQEKDTVISKLKEKINSFSGDDKERKVNREVEEIETQNLELDHKITKSERTTVATSPLANIDSNTPVLSSTRVTLVSSASESMSQDYTKKNRIRQTQKKAKKTELEDHLRTVKSSLNKASVVDSKATSSVIKSVLNVNSNLKCASCSGCLFFDNLDACVVAYINSVNARKKSKSGKHQLKGRFGNQQAKCLKPLDTYGNP